MLMNLYFIIHTYTFFNKRLIAGRSGCRAHSGVHGPGEGYPNRRTDSLGKQNPHVLLLHRLPSMELRYVCMYVCMYVCEL